MIGNIEEIIIQAQNDLPNAGVIIYDCNLHNLFYTPPSEIHSFREQLSRQDRLRFDAAHDEHLKDKKILVLTFHDLKMIDLATYEGPDNLAKSCPVEC